MGINKRKISELALASSLAGLYTIGVQAVGGVQRSVKVSLEFIQSAYDKMVDISDDAKKATEEAKKAAARATNISDHRDKIVNGEWWHWNEAKNEYENTGETAKGNVLYASLEIDPNTGVLYQVVDEDYKGAEFIVEDGILYSTINT